MGIDREPISSRDVERTILATLYVPIRRRVRVVE